MADPLEMMVSAAKPEKPDKTGKSPAATPELDAAKDALAAIKSGDATALSLALQRHYEACSDDGEEKDEPPASRPYGR